MLIICARAELAEARTSPRANTWARMSFRESEVIRMRVPPVGKKGDLPGCWRNAAAVPARTFLSRRGLTPGPTSEIGAWRDRMSLGCWVVWFAVGLHANGIPVANSLRALDT